MLNFFQDYPQIVFSSLSAISAFYLFFLILFQYKNRGSISFALLSGTMVIWQGGKVIKNLALVPEFPFPIATETWSNISFAGITFCYSLFLRLACRISFRDRGIFNILTYFGYLTSVLFIILEFKGLLSHGDVATRYGYYRQPTSLYVFYMLTFGAFMGLGLFVLYPRFYQKIPQIRKQTTAIFFGALFGFSLGSLEFVAILSKPIYPVADLAALLFGSILYWSIYRFNIIPASQIVRSTLLWIAYLATVLAINYTIYQGTMFVVHAFKIPATGPALIILFTVFVFMLTPLYLFLLRTIRRKFFPIRFFYKNIYMNLSRQLTGLNSAEQMVLTVLKIMESEFDYEKGTGIIFEYAEDRYIPGSYTLLGAPLHPKVPLKKILGGGMGLRGIVSRRGSLSELRLGDSASPNFKILMSIRLLERLKCDLIIPIMAKNQVAGLLLFKQKQYRPEPWNTIRPLLTSLSDVLGNHISQIHLLKAQSEKEHLSQVGMMAATMAHEIKNPLGGIYGAAQVLKEGSPSPKKFLDIILGDSSRLNDVVRRFLDFSSPFKSNFSEVEITGFLKNFIERQNNLAPEHPLELHTKLENIRLTTDPQGLEQILLNLSQNAQRYQQSQNSILIQAYKESGRLKISVEDDGRGIEEKDRPKIFTPFYTTSTVGTGLGLSISRKIAKALRGDLYFEALNPGSRFTLDLPMAV